MHFKPAIILVSLLLVNSVYAASAPRGHSRDTLIGRWSTVSHAYPEVNRNTGAPVRSAYTGRWFDFYADGTYALLIAASGRYITGSIIQQGSYELSGDRLLLHQQKESFYPAHNDPSGRSMYKDKSMPKEITLDIKFTGPREMIVRKEDNSSEEYTRSE